MDLKHISLVICTLIALCDGYKPKCLSVPALPAKVDSFIKTCQSEIKSNIIDDLVYTTLNDNPYSSAEYGELLKPHIEHLQHQSKHSKHKHHNHHHHSFADQIKKPHAHAHHHHSFEYFEPQDSHSQLWQKFPSLHLPTASPAGHFAEPHSLQSVEQHAAFPDYVIDTNYRITPTTLHATPASVEDRNEKVTDDKVVEAREELMKILANHKIVQRQVNRKSNGNSTATEKRSGRSKRGILEYFNGGGNKHHHHHDDLDHKHSALGDHDHFHPLLLTEADRWLAGCMMQCIFRKTHALDKHGYPTLDGIVDLYTEGVHDQVYFMYALRAVNKCLKIVSKAHSVKRSKVPLKAETCDIAFDVFDCVSDAITAYCH